MADQKLANFSQRSKSRLADGFESQRLQIELLTHLTDQLSQLNAVKPEIRFQIRIDIHDVSGISRLVHDVIDQQRI